MHKIGVLVTLLAMVVVVLSTDLAPRGVGTQTGVSCSEKDMMKVIVTYLDNLFHRNYTVACEQFNVDALYLVQGITAIEGRDNICAYLLFGDPDVTDVFELTQQDLLTTIVQESSCSVALTTNNTLRVVVPKSPELDHYNTIAANHINIDPKTGLIAHLHQFVDTLQSSQYINVLNEVNITELCNGILEYCTGPNKQYESFDECVQWTSPLPLHPAPTEVISASASQACRSFHLKLAQSVPVPHCFHAGAGCPKDQSEAPMYVCNALPYDPKLCKPHN